MRLTDDDLVDERKCGDELSSMPHRLCLGPYRRIWADIFRDSFPVDQARDEAHFREIGMPAYSLLPVAWNDGDPLPRGFDLLTRRPYHYLFWRDMPAGWQRGDALPDWCDNKPILASPHS